MSATVLVVEDRVMETMKDVISDAGYRNCRRFQRREGAPHCKAESPGELYPPRPDDGGH